jgi:hypothetical protein
MRFIHPFVEIIPPVSERRTGYLLFRHLGDRLKAVTPSLPTVGNR